MASDDLNRKPFRFVESLELLPLTLKAARFSDHAGARYRIHKADGSHVDVDAGSAAEAMAASGVKDAVKITNIELAQDVMIENRLVSLDDISIETTVAQDAPMRPAFFTAEMPKDEGEEESFIECALMDLVGSRKPAAPLVVEEAVEEAFEPAVEPSPEASEAGDVEFIKVADSLPEAPPAEIVPEPVEEAAVEPAAEAVAASEPAAEPVAEGVPGGPHAEPLTPTRIRQLLTDKP